MNTSKSNWLMVHKITTASTYAAMTIAIAITAYMIGMNGIQLTASLPLCLLFAVIASYVILKDQPAETGDYQSAAINDIKAIVALMITILFTIIAF
jgi:hypothetical protein